MKSKLLVLLFLVILPFVLAEGQVTELDFSETPELSVVVSESDVLRFTINEKEHKFMIRDIDLDDKRVETTIFIEDAEVPSYQNLQPGLVLKLDFERDGIADMDISIIRFIDKNRVLLYLKHIKEPTSKYSSRTAKFSGYFAFLNSINIPSWDAVKAGPSYRELKSPSYLKDNWWWPASLLVVLIILFWGKRGRKFSLKLRKMFR